MDDSKHYDLVAKTLAWITEHQFEQPSLSEISTEIGVSPFHLQRVFQAWAGVSPKQFLRSITRQAALERLAAGDTVLEAAIASGLSGPGRLHDLLISTDSLTPGEIRSRGRGISMHYGYGDTRFGPALVAWGARGISFLGFCNAEGREQAFTELTSRLSNANFQLDTPGAETKLDEVFFDAGSQPLRLWLRGTPFQLKVWQALLCIPEGANTTYGQIARVVGSKNAAQAVGNAVGSNPVSWIIPCHRVIRQLGEPGGYRWGTVTKKAMIGYESAGTARINAS